MEKNIIAVDLGAESGRVILGNISDQRLTIDVIHRFPNIPVLLNDGLHWDVLRLWHEIIEGLSQVVRDTKGNVISVGVDTWGVDFGLLDKNGALLANPYHYRDNRTDGMMEIAFTKMPKDEIFANTGIQFMQLNTLYQLLSMVEQNSPILACAKTILTMPDLFNYWLTGEITCEFSIATTTQCYDPVKATWSEKILDDMGIPISIFPEIIAPGTNLGMLRNDLANQIGGNFNVIAPATHDTGSAVAAVPSQTENFAWISSGTWSIMGINLPKPVITQESLNNNFTNEGGVNGSFRFSKNIMGLWLLQECRRTWSQKGDEYSYTELTSLAESAPTNTAVIDVDYHEFLKPGDMPARIQEYCRLTKQSVPTSVSEITRVILEGIALKYRWVLERLETQTKKALDTIYIIGGGTQNKLLNQLTADATGRKVVTGPIEATAIGNILTQAVTNGVISSLDQSREIVLNSFDSNIYYPQNAPHFEKAYSNLKDLLS